MSDILRIRTAQNVEIEYETASVGARIGAYLIDMVMKIAYILIFALILSKLSLNTYLSAYLAIPVFLPVVLYTFIFEKFMEGQTPGKRALNIKTVSMNGDPVTTGMHLLRWLMRIVDFQILPPIIAVVSIVIGEKGQRLGDMVANTSVIRLKGHVSLRDTAYSSVSENYKVTYTQATELEASAIATIKQVLFDQSDNRNALMESLANKLEKLLLIEREMDSEAFLKTIVKDYNHLISQELEF